MKGPMNVKPISSVFSTDLAIDLGTANTLVYTTRGGIILDEPSIVAVNKQNGNIEAVGADAKRMLGRTPEGITAIRPMRDGVLADFKAGEKMLDYFITRAHGRRFLVRPRVVVGVPAEITEVEKRAVIESAMRGRAREVHLVNQALVAAVGAGLPVTEAGGNMVVDIGGGTTDIAVVSLSGIVCSRSVRVAGNVMDEAIRNYMRSEYNLLIGEPTAEAVKVGIGSAAPLDQPLSMDVKGRDLSRGIPKSLTITDKEIRTALDPCISGIISAIRQTLETTPPELSGDISDRGIVLTGGGALLRNLDRRIGEETGLCVSIAEDPLTSVVMGIGRMLEDFRLLQQASLN
jgi:rod shape-determining protein MreB